MRTVADVLAVMTAATAAVAAGLGAWHWWRLGTSRAFWWLVRAMQLGTLGLALLAGVVLVTGGRPGTLFWVYALVPVVASFFAEQLRVVAAEQVLDRRGLADAAAVGGLDAAGQRGVVREIVRREAGVMAAAGLVVATLAVRLLETTSAL